MTGQRTKVRKNYAILLDAISVPAFIINRDHKVVAWNEACGHLTGIGEDRMLGTDRHWVAFYSQARPCLADLVVDSAIDQIGRHYEQHGKAKFAFDAHQAEGWYDNINGKRRYLVFEARPLVEGGQVIGAVELLHDITDRKIIEENLSKTSSELEIIFQNSSVGVIFLLNRLILRVNKTFETMFGYSTSELIGNTTRILYTSDAAYEDVGGKAYAYLVSGADSYRFDLETHRKDGSKLICELVGSLVDRNAPDKGTIWLFSDVTELRQAQEGLRDSRETAIQLAESFQALSDQLSAILNSMTESVFQVDHHGTLLAINDNAARRVSRAAYEMIGKCVYDFFPAEVSSGRKRNIEEVFRTGKPLYSEDTRNRHFFALNYYPTFNKDEDVVSVVVYAKDITDRKLLEEELRNIAFHDSLTRLPNRRLLLDRLDHAIHTSQRQNSHVAVLFLDLNKFKQLNDAYGHDVGDLLLMEVASRLRKAVRESDTVARLGGDEFVILLEGLGTDKDQASEYANSVMNKISHSLSEDYVLGDIIHHGSASIGIKLVLGDHADADQILKDADAAMYEAKKASQVRR